MSTEAQIEAYVALDLKGQSLDAYDVIALTGPSTYDEVELLTGMLRVSARRAVNNLRNAGIVKDSGTKRLGDSGANQTVWELGDDRTIVREHQIASVRNQARRLGFDLVPTGQVDQAAAQVFGVG
jgi:predicted transcriptional regulator